MHGRTILVGQLEIVLDHVQGGMSEKLLEDKNVAAIPQKRDGERVSKAVRVRICHIRSLSNPFDQTR